MRVVAALYVDPRGPYPSMPGVDCWDETRDARLYDGPHPVVTHAPCGPWGHLSRLSRNQDPDLAVRALEQVRTWGGAFEHPLGSRLWEEFDLPPPRRYSPQPSLFGDDVDGATVDRWGGRTLLVEQVSWGHVCRKPTLLYVVRVDPAVVTAGWRTGGVHTHAISSKKRRKHLLAPCAAARRRTPVAFAEWLVSLARSVTAA